MDSWDQTDDREASVMAAIGQPSLVTWRADVPWHPGEVPCDRCVLGLVEGEAGPEVFLATARHAGGGRASATVHYRAALGAAFAEDGSRLEVKNTHDGAVVGATYDMDANWIARAVNVGSALHLLKATSSGNSEPALVLTVSRFISKGNAEARVVQHATLEELERLWWDFRHLEAAPAP